VTGRSAAPRDSERPSCTTWSGTPRTFIAPREDLGPGCTARGRDTLPSLPCSRPATKRGAETGYAASDFFAGAESFFESDFVSEDDDVEDSVLDSFFSPPSFPDRSISRLRRFVP
jgi:hypothetical protein